MGYVVSLHIKLD